MSHPTSSSVILASTLFVATLTTAPARAEHGRWVPEGPVRHHAVCSAPEQEAVMRCHAHVVVDADGRPRLSGPTGPVAGYSPSQLASAYGMPPKPAFVGGLIPVIAVVDAYDYPKAASDLAAYRAKFGLPPLAACPNSDVVAGGPAGAVPCFSKLNQVGSSTSLPAPDTTGWSQEAALDIEMASAMCPRCTIILVEANSAADSDLGAAVNTAAAFANAISNSYGGAERSTTAFAAYYDHPGVAITASAGDTAYAGGAVEFPASYTHVIAVGGTTLTPSSSARGWNETVWRTSGSEATVSGCSSLYAAPAGQRSALPVATACERRVVADLAAVADPATGVAVYGPASICAPSKSRPGAPSCDPAANPSGWMVFGGTSVAAPLVAGIYAVGFGIRGVAVTDPVGNLYSQYANGRAAFNDVTPGSDGNSARPSCGNPAANTFFLCNAGPGFDAPSGLGSPNGYTAL